MALRYGLPIFLEDQTGLLTGSKFVDLYNRKTLSYECISHDSMGTTYGVSDCGSVRYKPDVILQFGADNSLGSIKVGNGVTIAMDIYLPRVSFFARCNLFVLYLMIAC
jgi:hypothetical protein